MVVIFAAETPLSDEDKAMLLVIFVVIGATAIIGLLISTSSAERWMSKVASAVNLYLVLFWLGIYQLALGLFFPKFEWKQIMSLDFRVSYIWANIVFFVFTVKLIVFIWNDIFNTSKVLIFQ